MDVPTAGGSLEQPGQRNAARRPSGKGVVLLALLLISVVAVGFGGVFAASKLSRPALRPSALAQNQVVTLYNTSGSQPPAKVDPGPPPPPCNCTLNTVNVPRPTPTPVRPPDQGQMIVVSLTKEWLWAYQDGKQVFDTPVTTGRPELPTVTGTFSVMGKFAPIEFTSPWPPGSPFWYAPTHINFALLFADGGYFLHDAWWRNDFGPGSNQPHTLPDGTFETGSHGCVQMPTPAAQWLYNWADVGTIVQVDA